MDQKKNEIQESLNQRTQEILRKAEEIRQEILGQAEQRKAEQHESKPERRLNILTNRNTLNPITFQI